MEMEKARAIAAVYSRYDELRTMIADLKSDHSTKPDGGFVSVRVPVRWLPIIWKVAEEELEKYEKIILDK